MSYRLLIVGLSVLVWHGAALSAPVEAGAAPAAYPALSDFGGDFTLTDQEGQSFSLEHARGKVALIYFGFTSCAETCPIALSQVAAAMRKLGSLSARVQPLFITVDPARDTPELLRQYLPRFHPSIRGLTGTQQQVEAVAEKYRAPVYVRHPHEGGTYVVDHSSYLYVVGPDGELANLIRYGDSVGRIVSVVQALLLEQSSQQNAVRREGKEVDL